MAEDKHDKHRKKGEVGDWDRGELKRFIQKAVSEPGVVAAENIVNTGKFLRLRGRAARGTTTLNGGGSSSASVVVNHGLTDAQGDPLTPEQILVTTNNLVVLASASGRSSTQFTLNNRHVDNAAYAVDVRNDWLVIA